MLDKDKAVMNLWRAEIKYLDSRGWVSLIGGRDPKYMVAPGDDYKAEGCKFHTHNEALQIQKEKDGMNV